MIRKRPLASRPVSRVTFEIPAEVGANHASVVGDFNGWDPHAHAMRRLKDGRLTVTIPLAVGASYAFRYLTEGGAWHDDEQADGQVANPFGGVDSLVVT